MISGVFDLPWWGYVLVTLALTHVTIASVTIFLHRHQAHRALELHPIPSHFFRFWLWLTTGMVTKEWAAIHRKHHAKCETADDPHSPQVKGIRKVMLEGAELYRAEARNAETLQRYGHGTPDDWLERHVYRRSVIGISLMLILDVVLFGPIGITMWAVQMAWIPFWAAGVINGAGHYWGYRNFDCADASTNLVPWCILVGGEELHNNHHAYPTSAKLSNRWYEFDMGWLYIRLLEALGLAKVKHVAPIPRLAAPKPTVDPATLEAVIRCRYDVLAKYARHLKQTYNEELGKLRGLSPQGARALRTVEPWLDRDDKMLREVERVRIAEVLRKSLPLQTMYSMRRELAAIWGRSTATSEQLVKQLQEWCRRAEASGIGPLLEFSRRLRCYA